MLLTGIDIVEIERFEKSFARESFFEKTYGEIEKEYLEKLSDNRKIQSAAAFFAAKEAFGKAFGQGIFKYPLSLVQVAHRKSGRPYLVIDKKVAETVDFKDFQIDISLSHSENFAVAVVTAFGGD